jgi:cell division protein FtsI (penicillin-binding protein 3)
LLGEERLYKYLKAFRIGDKTGIDLPGEEFGILHARSKWSNLSIARIPIGQGVSVTAVQLLSVYCAIANDGNMMKPYIVSRIVGTNGTVIAKNEPEVIARPISAQTSATMRRLLSRVTEEGGTGIHAQVDGYEVAGKTGTAEKPVRGGYSSTAYTASFVGFLPADNPEIGVIVVVDEPQPCHLGGKVAAPAFTRIAGQTVRYLDIPSSEAKIVSTR